MTRKILLGVALGSVLLVGVPCISYSRTSQNESGKQTQATKSVSGKVASIGNNGKSFVVEVDNGSSDSKQNMEFVLDKDTQVEGHVTTGTMVLVEYQPSGGQNLCVKVSARQS
jgi:hypothetical protein